MLYKLEFSLPHSRPINSALLNPVLLNPVLLNPVLLNPVLLNPVPQNPVRSMSLPQPFNAIDADVAREVKLIFFDVDGTLLDSAGQFSPELVHELARLKARGLALAIASGRPPFACQFLFDGLGLVDTGLFYTGSLIYKPDSQLTLLRHSLAQRDALALFQQAQSQGLYFELYDQQRLIVDTELNVAPHILAEHCRQLRIDPSCEALEPLLLTDRESPWVKVLLGEDTEQSNKLAALEEQFPELHFAYAKLPAYPNWRFASVIPAAADKNRAFDTLLDHYQLRPEQVMAFGDAGSDKVFLSRAGLGVAMEPAAKDVKACADFVCPSSDENGVARALAAFFPA